MFARHAVTMCFLAVGLQWWTAPAVVAEVNITTGVSFYDDDTVHFPVENFNAGGPTGVRVTADIWSHASTFISVTGGFWCVLNGGEAILTVGDAEALHDITPFFEVTTSVTMDFVTMLSDRLNELGLGALVGSLPEPVTFLLYDSPPAFGFSSESEAPSFLLDQPHQQTASVDAASFDQSMALRNAILDALPADVRNAVSSSLQVEAVGELTLMGTGTVSADRISVQDGSVFESEGASAPIAFSGNGYNQWADYETTSTLEVGAALTYSVSVTVAGERFGPPDGSTFEYHPASVATRLGDSGGMIRFPGFGTLQVEVDGSFYSAGSAVNLGAVPVGETRRATVVLRNNAQVPLTLAANAPVYLAADDGLDAFMLDGPPAGGTVLAVGATITFDVVFIADEPLGPRVAVMSVSSSDILGPYVLELRATSLLADPFAIECPTNSLTGNAPSPTAMSVLSENPGPAIFEYFSGTSELTSGIVFWGAEATSVDPCLRDPSNFAIRFHADSAGTPGALIAERFATIEGVFTGILESGIYPLYRYEILFDEPVFATDAWVSVQGVDDTMCHFYWQPAATGDGLSWIRDSETTTEHALLYDFSYCLLSSETEGAFEGEGAIEGEVGVQSADQDGDFLISLYELLRVIQFYNATRFGCQAGTEDGYAPNVADDSCPPHSSDYNIQDWEISLSELLRLIQFYNLGAYRFCPDEIPMTEDRFCPGA